MVHTESPTFLGSDFQRVPQKDRIMGRLSRMCGEHVQAAAHARVYTCPMLAIRQAHVHASMDGWFT
jgi:hypothetical protein